MTKLQTAKGIIREYQRAVGYLVCNLCYKRIERGQRIKLVREVETKNRFPRRHDVVIGSVCFDCYKRLEMKL